MSELLPTIDRHILYARLNRKPLAALMMSPQSFAELAEYLPERQRKRRRDGQMIDAYRGVPIHIHDEWSWGWMLRATDGSFISLNPESQEA